NDDPTPDLTIDNVPVVEGNSGTTTEAVFTVKLSAPSGQEITLNYATADGIAKAGKDYVAKSGSITFSEETTTQTIRVTIISDDLNEVDETFFVNLTNANPSQVNMVKTQGVGTITND